MRRSEALTETLAQIEAPGFRAGIVMWDDRVVEAAPIVKNMKGMTRDQVRDHCRRQGWRPRVIWEMERTDIGVRYLLGGTTNWSAVAKSIVEIERIKPEPGGSSARA